MKEVRRGQVQAQVYQGDQEERKLPGVTGCQHKGDPAGAALFVSPEALHS